MVQRKLYLAVYLNISFHFVTFKAYLCARVSLSSRTLDSWEHFHHYHAAYQIYMLSLYLSLYYTDIAASSSDDVIKKQLLHLPCSQKLHW